jgi:hypothetical protein
MSKHTLVALVVAAVLLTLLAMFGERGSDTAESGQGSELVPQLDAAINEIEQITLATAGGETAATLERGADGWMVVQKGGYRADVGKIREGLRALAEARILEPKTANPQLHSRLGVEDVENDTAAGVAVSFTAPGRDLPTVILGNAEGAKYRYARRAADAQSYLIDRDPDLPRNAAQWVDPQIIDLRSDRVQQVTISHPDGELVTLSKASRDAPNFDVANVPEGRELLYPGAANVVGNALRELRLEDVQPVAASAAPATEVVVEFRTFDGLVVVARGSEEGDQAWIALTASFDAEQAARFDADVAATGSEADEQPADEAPVPAEDEALDPSAEAQRINERVTGWRYRIASYQYDQLTRHVADLLKPVP